MKELTVYINEALVKTHVIAMPAFTGGEQYLLGDEITYIINYINKFIDTDKELQHRVTREKTICFTYDDLPRTLRINKYKGNISFRFIQGASNYTSLIKSYPYSRDGVNQMFEYFKKYIAKKGSLQKVFL